MIEAMVATSAALARLLMQMHDLSVSARRSPTGEVALKAYWTAGDLSPPSPLLEGMNPNTALSGATSRVLGIQARLLSAATSGDEIDPLWVCRVLQALGDDFATDFSPVVKRMAQIVDAQLPAEPRDLHNGLGLREFVQRGEWRPPPAYSAGKPQPPKR